MANLARGFRALLDEANAQVGRISPAELRSRLGEPDLAIIDLREADELERHGRIPGSIHAPRGELEFHADPECPFHLPVFASGKFLVLHCAGGWRSALAAKTLQEMGLRRVAHLEGGFTAWKEIGAPVESLALESHEADTQSARGPRATGIGGVFFKCRDTKAIAAWYATHLGLPVDGSNTAMFEWRDSGQTGASAQTVWAPFPDSTPYFGRASQQFMVNFRVAQLDRLLTNLRARGVAIEQRIDQYDYGRFAWITDPEGNRVELWEPTAIKPH